MNALIVYYSLSGTTKKLAARMAGMLGCEAVKVPLFGTYRPPAGETYDVVIIGTPIWLYAPAFPVSRFLSKNRDRLPEVAFFCTYQTTIGSSFEKMGRKCGKKPLGTLKLMGPEIGTDAGDLQLKQYIDLISKKAGQRRGDGQ